MFHWLLVCQQILWPLLPFTVSVALTRPTPHAGHSHLHLALHHDMLVPRTRLDMTGRASMSHPVLGVIKLLVIKLLI